MTTFRPEGPGELLSESFSSSAEEVAGLQCFIGFAAARASRRLLPKSVSVKDFSSIRSEKAPETFTPSFVRAPNSASGSTSMSSTEFPHAAAEQVVWYGDQRGAGRKRFLKPEEKVCLCQNKRRAVHRRPFFPYFVCPPIELVRGNFSQGIGLAGICVFVGILESNQQSSLIWIRAHRPAGP